MRRGSVCLLWLWASTACVHGFVRPEAGPSSAPPLNVVPAGTLVEAQLKQPLSTATNHPGDRFTAELLDPLVDAGGETLAAKGALVDGIVRTTQRSAVAGLPVGLGLAVLGVREAGQETTLVPLEVERAPVDLSSIVGREILGGVLGAAVGAGAGVGIDRQSAGVVVGSTFIGLGLGVLGAYLFGTRDATIPAGSVVTLRVTRDVPVSRPLAAETPTQ